MRRWKSQNALRCCISARSSSRVIGLRLLPIRVHGRCILATSALRLSHIDAFYGDSHVLGDVSFELGEARMLGLLGRNGAGKSTCMNVTMGLLPPRRGEVAVFGEQVTGLSPEIVAARGVALVPQGRRIFKSLTVR